MSFLFEILYRTFFDQCIPYAKALTNNIIMIFLSILISLISLPYNVKNVKAIVNSFCTSECSFNFMPSNGWRMFRKKAIRGIMLDG